MTCQQFSVQFLDFCLRALQNLFKRSATGVKRLYGKNYGAFSHNFFKAHEPSNIARGALKTHILTKTQNLCNSSYLTTSTSILQRALIVLAKLSRLQSPSTMNFLTHNKFSTACLKNKRKCAI